MNEQSNTGCDAEFFDIHGVIADMKPAASRATRAGLSERADYPDTMRRIRTRAACYIALGCVFATTGTAVAQALPEAIQACRKETDDGLRLACFDREVAKFSQSVQPTFGVTAAPVGTVERPSSKNDVPIKSLTATVVELRDRLHAGFVVTLDNGQVWMQNELEATRGVKVGDTVTIKPGALGSFWLVGPTGWPTKAHRVR
jgi:hypothetical protein